MKLTRVILFVMLAGLMVLFAGCGGTNQTANGNDAVANDTADNNNTSGNDAANDDTNVVDTGDDVEAMVISSDLVLDPALIALDDISSQIISDYLYDGLVVQEADGSIGPALALTADEADDGLTYVFTLRTDAVFADGSQVTADVILWNFNRWFDPEHPLHGADEDFQAWVAYFLGFRGQRDADENPVSLFDGIEKEDDLTVLIHLNEPMDDFLEIISLPFFSILNPAALEAGDYGMSVENVDGTGPYFIETWTDAGLTLAPNPDHWGEVPSEVLLFSFE